MLESRDRESLLNSLPSNYNEDGPPIHSNDTGNIPLAPTRHPTPIDVGGEVRFPHPNRYYAVTRTLFRSKDRESLANSLPSNDAEDGPDAIRLATFNVQGITKSAKLHHLRKLLLDQRVDLCALQETKWNPDTSFTVSRVFQQHLHSNCPRGVAGTAIVSPHGYSDRATLKYSSPDGRLVISRINVRGLHAQLVSVYCPANSQERRAFMPALQEALTANLSQELPTILAGDFNFVEDPARDRSNRLNSDVPSTSILQEISTEWDLLDAWSALKTEIGHTWHRMANGTAQTSRIDRVYISASLLPSIVDIKLICPRIRISDHLPLMIEIAPPVEQAPRRFTLNVKVLDDRDTLQQLEDIAEETITSMSDPTADVMAKYLAGKKRMHRLVQTRGRAAAIERRQDEQEAREELQECFDRLNVAPQISVSHITDYRMAQARVEAFEEQHAELARLAAQEMRFLQNEKCNKWFFQKAKAKAETKKIRTLKDRQGRTQHGTTDLLATIHAFYQNLFADEGTTEADTSLLINALDARLSTDDCTWLDRTVTAAEVSAIIKTLPKHKAPGPDGMPYELFQKLEHLFAEMLARLAEAILHGNQAQVNRPTFCKALIILLPKKGDLAECSNWRPISLINSDYKVLMALLTARLGSVIGSIVGEHQTGFIPGRSIFHSILATKAALERNRHAPSGYLLLLDLEKAYDRVNHAFLFRVLSKFGFPPSWIGALETLYGCSTSQVLVNGFPTTPIRLQRGVRQGCPLSPLLFALAIEPLACMIRNATDLRGLHITAELVLKVLLYADDTTLLLADREALALAEQILAIFERGSGAKVNSAKSELLPATTSPQTAAGSRFNLQPTDYTARLLGAQIGVQQSDSTAWELIITGMKTTMAAWRSHGLSLRGKVLVTKVLILSQATFLLHVADMPDDVAKRMDKLIATFIWGTPSREWTLRDAIIAPKEAGGLDAPSLRLWRQSIWRTTMTKLQHPGTWHDLLDHALNHMPGVFRRLRDSLDLPALRRPRHVMAELRPPFPMAHYLAKEDSLLRDLDPELLAALLPIRTARRSHRKVFDVRWRILTNCAVAKHPPSQCPHCQEPDSTRHRFWECRTAVETRAHAHRLNNAFQHESPAHALVFPTPAALATSDAALWRVHLLALRKARIIRSAVPTLDHLYDQFRR